MAEFEAPDGLQVVAISVVTKFFADPNVAPLIVNCDQAATAARLRLVLAASLKDIQVDGVVAQAIITDQVMNDVTNMLVEAIYQPLPLGEDLALAMVDACSTRFETDARSQALLALLRCCAVDAEADRSHQASPAALDAADVRLEEAVPAAAAPSQGGPPKPESRAQATKSLSKTATSTAKKEPPTKKAATSKAAVTAKQELPSFLGQVINSAALDRGSSNGSQEDWSARKHVTPSLGGMADITRWSEYEGNECPELHLSPEEIKEIQLTWVLFCAKKGGVEQAESAVQDHLKKHAPEFGQLLFGTVNKNLEIDPATGLRKKRRNGQGSDREAMEADLAAIDRAVGR
jgi:hypothetical protein